MAKFTVRIVLHGVDDSDTYQELHDQMALDLSALRQIQGPSGTWYDLPDGEYDVSSDSTTDEVRAAALAAAMKVQPKPRPSVLVTKSAGRAWNLYPVPGDS